MHESHKELTKRFQRKHIFISSKSFLFEQKNGSELLFFIEKKIRKIHFESPILSLRDKAAKQGKAVRDACNRRGLLFL